MKRFGKYNAVLALLAGTFGSLSGQDVLITCWEWSNLTGADTGNTFPANVSDQVAGDGEATDGLTGTMYADGQFGSSNIDNSAAFTFAAFTPSSAFNNDVPTDSRPAANDLGGDGIDNAPARLSISDGSFGVGGAADPSGKHIVFAVKAIDGSQFSSAIQFTSAIGTTAASMEVAFDYSYDGNSYTALSSFTATSQDEQGPSFTFNDASGNTTLYLRLKLPTMGFDALYLDNLQFIGELSAGAAPGIELSGNLAFGDVAIGSNATATLSISNPGDAPLNVTGITYPDSVFTGDFSGTIAAGGSEDVTVTFTPTAEETYSGDLSVQSDAASGTSTLAISGTGVAAPEPAIALSGNLAFGDVSVGGSATATLTISNPGSAPLNVVGITYPDAVFSGDFSGTISAGGSQEVTVSFAPAVEQAYTGELSVQSDAASGDNTLAISGTGTTAPASAIALSGNLAFGDVEVGSSATATLTISNNGNASLNVTGITYPDAVFTGDFSGNIAAGGSEEVTVTFSPTADQAYSGELTVQSDAASGTNTLAISGTGTIVPAPAIALSGNLAFGAVAVGDTATATLIISNPGGAPLNVTGITYPDPVFSGDFSGTIAAGESAEVLVAFAPVVPQSIAGMLTVQSDAASGINTLAIGGTGTAAPAPVIDLLGDLVFGEVSVGESATATLTITNTGTAPLNVTGITYPDPVFTGDFSGAIAEGSSEEVTVTFAPTAEQSYSGDLSVQSDAASGTSTLAVSGTGTPAPAPGIELSGELAFGDIAVDSSATAILTITNTGTAPLNVTGITYPDAVFTGDFSGAIAEGSSEEVTVTFAPTAEQSYSGDLSVQSDAASGTSTLAVSGTGTPAPAPGIELSGELAFGDVAVDSSATAILTITNTGTAPLNITGITYPDAVFTGDFSGAIAEGSSEEVTVTFAPTAEQSYSGDLSVQSDAASGTSTLAVSGTGIFVSVSYWENSPETNGWKPSGEGYPGEVGIGWVYDVHWPWIYTFSMGDPQDGDWVYILDGIGDRVDFWGYNYDGGYYFNGSSLNGLYVRFVSGTWDLYAFNL